MADAYGKLTGRPAVCFGIAGPGSTNLLTGLYDAKVDRAPVLAISGQVPSKVLGRGAFQDLDLERAFADVAQYSQAVQAGSDIFLMPSRYEGFGLPVLEAMAWRCPVVTYRNSSLIEVAGDAAILDALGDALATAAVLPHLLRAHGVTTVDQLASLPPAS